MMMSALCLFVFSLAIMCFFGAFFLCISVWLPLRRSEGNSMSHDELFKI